MAAHGSVRSSAYDHVERSQYFQGHMAGMSAHERHTKLVSDYQRFYQNPQLTEPTEAKPSALLSTDFDALRQGHRFLRSEADDAESSWEAKLAKRYYARLYKEYAVADLSRWVINIAALHSSNWVILTECDWPPLTHCRHMDIILQLTCCVRTCPCSGVYLRHCIDCVQVTACP